MQDERFDGWAVEPPAEPWGYELDDYGDRYTRRRPWPFEKHYPAHKDHTGTMIPAGWAASSVRIAPDSAFQSWRQEYVILSPSDDGALISGILSLWIRPQGMGAMISRCTFSIRLAVDGQIIGWMLGEVSPKLRDQAEQKLSKIKALIWEHVQARTAGKRRPRTAHERWEAEQQAVVS